MAIFYHEILHPFYSLGREQRAGNLTASWLKILPVCTLGTQRLYFGTSCLFLCRFGVSGKLDMAVSTVPNASVVSVPTVLKRG